MKICDICKRPAIQATRTMIVDCSYEHEAICLSCARVYFANETENQAYYDTIDAKYNLSTRHILDQALSKKANDSFFFYQRLTVISQLVVALQTEMLDFNKHENDMSSEEFALLVHESSETDASLTEITLFNVLNVLCSFNRDSTSKVVVFMLEIVRDECVSYCSILSDKVYHLTEQALALF